MAIKGQLFTTASIIYESILGSKSNMAPESPEHAYRAHRIAEELWKACRENSLLAQAAARAIAGFLQNVRSAHASDVELISLGLHAAGQLAEAFKAPTIENPGQAMRRPVPRAPVAQTPPLPEMPPAGVPEVPAVFVPPPVTSLDVPDFES